MRYYYILKNEKFLSLLAQLKELEAGREYCKHGIEHLMDVARIAYILSLEKGLDIDKDIIYTTALLHDVGRGEQYISGRDHHNAGAIIAGEILREMPYSSEETEMITSAIAAHGHKSDGDNLKGILYAADKLSRACFLCPANEKCNWDQDKKNYILRY